MLLMQLDRFITTEFLYVTPTQYLGRFVARSSLFLTRSGAAITYLIPNKEILLPC